MNTTHPEAAPESPSPAKIPVPPQRFDPLANYAAWVMSLREQIFPICPARATERVGAFSGITLRRDGEFQIQLWLCDPNSEIPDHSHPNVDTIQVYVCGQVYFRLNGQPVIRPEELCELEDGTSNANGAKVRVGPNDTHGATIGEMGGAFLVFQRFLNGVAPKSVHLDWHGEPLSEDHAVAIRQQQR